VSEYNKAKEELDRTKTSFDELDTQEIRNEINNSWEYEGPALRHRLLGIAGATGGEGINYVMGYNPDLQGYLTSVGSLSGGIPWRNMGGTTGFGNFVKSKFGPPTLGVAAGAFYPYNSDAQTQISSAPQTDPITFVGGNPYNAVWRDENGNSVNLTS